MVFGFVLLSTGNPHLYKWEILLSSSWAVGFEIPWKTILALPNWPASCCWANRESHLCQGRNVTAQQQILHCPGFGGNESRALGKANEGNNRAGRAAGAWSTADLFGRKMSNHFGKISFGVAGRPWLVSSVARYQSFPHFLGSGCLWKGSNPEPLVPGVAVSQSFSYKGLSRSRASF